MELMAQLQAQIPDPLADHLPQFLSSSRVTTPAGSRLFLIFIGKGRFKGATMQIQLDDIGGDERLLRQLGEEEFVDDARTRDANPALLFAGWMGRHHHAAMHARGSHRHIRAVVEAAHKLAFRTTLELIWGQVQTRLDEWMIQHGVLFAAHHEREASQICKHGPGAILPIEPQQGALLRELVCSEVATDGPEDLAQFRPVEPVASVAKRAEPLIAVGLADDGAGTDDFPTLAPCVASSTDFIQPAKGR